MPPDYPPRRRQDADRCDHCCKSAPLSFAQSKDPIKVGVLHSLSGTMAISKRCSKTWLMAIEEINAKGGVMGRKLRSRWWSIRLRTGRCLPKRRVS